MNKIFEITRIIPRDICKKRSFELKALFLQRITVIGTKISNDPVKRNQAIKNGDIESLNNFIKAPLNAAIASAVIRMITPVICRELPEGTTDTIQMTCEENKELNPEVVKFIL